VIIDFSVARPAAAVQKKAGVTAVGRYLGWDSVPGYASIGKNITPAEARTYLAAGIAIFLAFEYGPQAATGGYAQGIADGALAAEQLAALGAPDGTVVYFTVDFDLPDYAPSLPDTPVNARAKLGPVAHYFDGIAQAIAGAAHAGTYLRPGVYGGYYAVKRVLDAGLAVMGWQTTAWSGGQVDRDPRVVLYQTGATTLGGADVNVHEGTAADFGQWPRPAAPHPAPPPAPSAQERLSMIIVTVDRAGVPPGKPWPGVFLHYGPKLLYHIPDQAELELYRRLGYPEHAKPLPYADYLLLGGK